MSSQPEVVTSRLFVCVFTNFRHASTCCYEIWLYKWHIDGGCWGHSYRQYTKYESQWEALAFESVITLSPFSSLPHRQESLRHKTDRSVCSGIPWPWATGLLSLVASVLLQQCRCSVPKTSCAWTAVFLFLTWSPNRSVIFSVSAGWTKNWV